jgi:hypothetical protein
MKLKNILACAVGAGLLTFAAGSARALVIDDEVAPVLDVQLTVKFTEDNGKTKSVSITSKDLLIAIGEDFEGDSDFYKGDEIALVDDADYWILDKHGDELVDLSDDDVISYDHTELTESEKETDDSFKESQTGVASFTFASNGDTGDELDNEIYCSQDDVPYAYTVTETAINHHSDKFTETVTEKGGIATEGFDFDVFDNDDVPLPIFGTVTQDGSGTIEE